MKTLIITAHPSSHGLTHGIAASVARARKEKGIEVEILDLYQTELKQDFLQFENVREIPPNPARDIIQKKITEADELIFIHPIWWLSMPAILKNFIDHNFSSRFAYRYINGKPVGLLGGKTARVYVTCDASILLYALLAFPFATQWIIGILIFCGIKVKDFTIIRNRNFKDDSERAVYLEKLKRKSFNTCPVLLLLNKVAHIVR